MGCFSFVWLRSSEAERNDRTVIGDYNIGAGEIFIVVLRSAVFLGTDFTLIPKASQYGNDANEICGFGLLFCFHFLFFS